MTEEFINDPEVSHGLDGIEDLNSNFDTDIADEQELLETAPERVVAGEWEELQTAKADFKQAVHDVDDALATAKRQFLSTFGISENEL